MVTKTAAPHAAITAGFAINGFALFKGYSNLEAGQEQILTVGAPVRIDRFENEADIVVIGVDEDGNDIMSEDGTTPKFAERVFPEELTPAELDADAPATDEAAVVADAPAADAPTATAPVTKPETAAAKKKREAAEAKAATAAAPKAETAAAKKKREAAAAKEAAATEKAATKAANKAKADAAKVEKAKAKEAAAAKKITATPVIEIADMASVKEILAEQDALAAAQSLVDRAEQTDFTLGGVLRHIHETGAFKSIGYEGKRGFVDYCEQTLGIAYRKAHYLMTIYTAFAMIGADEEKLQQIGWSKAKELARIETGKLKKDFDSLIGKATEMTRNDLTAFIKKTYKVTTRGGGDQVALTSFSFRLAEEDAEMVNSALTEAKTMTGEDDLNKAFAYIVGDWRNTGTGTDMSLDDTIELMVAKFGITGITYTDAEGVEHTPTLAEADQPAGEADVTATA